MVPILNILILQIVGSGSVIIQDLFAFVDTILINKRYLFYITMSCWPFSCTFINIVSNCVILCIVYKSSSWCLCFQSSMDWGTIEFKPFICELPLSEWTNLDECRWASKAIIPPNDETAQVAETLQRRWELFRCTSCLVFQSFNDLQLNMRNTNVLLMTINLSI